MALGCWPIAQAEGQPQLGVPYAAGGDGQLTLFLAGDTIIPLPWSADEDPGFLALVAEMRAADVTVVNLELVLHSFKGYAQADSGGTYVSGPPEIARELAWAGVDIVATANNHAFDWGSIGVLENIDSLVAAGLRWAGTGADLQRARAPAYVDHPDGRVALVATASSFISYGRASRSRPDVAGRPGLNPLRTEIGRFIEVPPWLADAVGSAAPVLGLPVRHLDETWLEVGGLRLRIGGGPALRGGRRVDPSDLQGNLAAVAEASESATVVIFSIHAHHQGPWLAQVAQQAIESGANVVLIHGPHEMRGIELHRGAPIFYSLGDFVFQPEQSARFPSESYEPYGLDDSATPDDYRRKREEEGLWPGREPWESVAALLRFDRGGELRELTLLPLTLGMDAPPGVKGKPRRAGTALGREIIDRISERSRGYGTRVRYDPERNVGIVLPVGSDAVVPTADARD